tara:strand:+ start:273 stop:428 length:156 start_codon:yes stop_codon:yes gene_type:complete
MSEPEKTPEDASQPAQSSLTWIALQVLGIVVLLVLALWCGRQGSYFVYQGF